MRQFASAFRTALNRNARLFLDSTPCCCCSQEAPELCRRSNLSPSRVASRANRKHVVDGGERGHAGADGPDGHVRPRGPGRVSAFWRRGQQCCLPRHRSVNKHRTKASFVQTVHIFYFRRSNMRLGRLMRIIFRQEAPKPAVHICLIP